MARGQNPQCKRFKRLQGWASVAKSILPLRGTLCTYKIANIYYMLGSNDLHTNNSLENSSNEMNGMNGMIWMNVMNGMNGMSGMNGMKRNEWDEWNEWNEWKRLYYGGEAGTYKHQHRFLTIFVLFTYSTLYCIFHSKGERVKIFLYVDRIPGLVFFHLVSLFLMKFVKESYKCSTLNINWGRDSNWSFSSTFLCSISNCTTFVHYNSITACHKWLQRVVSDALSTCRDDLLWKRKHFNVSRV